MQQKEIRSRTQIPVMIIDMLADNIAVSDVFGSESAFHTDKANRIKS